jgi:hypothetical protein
MILGGSFDGAVSASYRLAGRTVVSDCAVDELRAFRTADMRPVRPRSQRFAAYKPAEAVRTFSGPGWIDNRWLDVEAYWSAEGYWLEVADAGLFWVAGDGGMLVHVDRDPDAVQSTVIQTALGPGLILALALQGVWCLHASAVTTQSHAVAFIGESGNGKSTLAAYMGSEADLGWSFATDDILPIELGPGKPCVLPHFPQLKLPNDVQPATRLPERLPLTTIYVLGGQGDGGDEVSIHSLSAQEAALALIRHTATTRLFGAALLKNHLAACTDIAASMPVRELSYPRTWNALPAVQRAIAADSSSRRQAG